MSIGTGIFLGALSIAIVLLYAVTKDRWDWRKIARRFGFGSIALVVLLLFAGICKSLVTPDSKCELYRGTVL
jgi:putative copper export protein